MLCGATDLSTMAFQNCEKLTEALSGRFPIESPTAVVALVRSDDIERIATDRQQTSRVAWDKKLWAVKLFN